MIVFGIYTGFGGYLIDSNRVIVVDPNDYSEHVIYIDKLQEEVEEEVPVVEEVIPESVSTVSHVEAREETFSGNSIHVASIHNYLMDDDGGSFYLNHDIYGNYDGLGVPFVDFRNDFTDRKSIVYAHSSLAGNGPFQALQNYHNNPGYFYSNPIITVNYNGNTYMYQIFSVYVSVAEDEYSEGLDYYYRMHYSDEEWEEEIQKYKNHSEYDTGVSVSGSDKIIILQTCSMDPNYYEQYYRYNLLIMGKLI